MSVIAHHLHEVVTVDMRDLLLGGEDLGSKEEGGAEDDQPQVYFPFPSMNL
jgi:hypothetical protein